MKITLIPFLQLIFNDKYLIKVSVVFRKEVLVAVAKKIHLYEKYNTILNSNSNIGS